MGWDNDEKNNTFSSNFSAISMIFSMLVVREVDWPFDCSLIWATSCKINNLLQIILCKFHTYFTTIPNTFRLVSNTISSHTLFMTTSIISLLLHIKKNYSLRRISRKSEKVTRVRIWKTGKAGYQEKLE